MLNKERKDIAVFVSDEQASKRLVARAREIANDIGCYLYAVASKKVSYNNCDKVVIASSAEEEWNLLLSNPIRVCLFDLSQAENATRLAHHFDSGLLAPVFDLHFDSSAAKFVYKVKSFSGRLVREVVFTRTPEFAVVDTSLLSEPADLTSGWAELMQPGS